MIKLIVIILLIASFFYPALASWSFVLCIIFFEGYLLLISLRKPRFSQVNLDSNNNLDENEKQIYKKYFLYFRFPHTAKSFSKSLSLISLSVFIFVPWLLFHRLWLQAVIIGFNYFLAGILSSKLDARFYLHDAVERRGMEEFRSEMLLVDSICNKILIQQTEKVSSIKLGDQSDSYEFINNAGGKETITLGYDDTKKCDIYWDDVVASKNNKKEIITANGISIDISGFDPDEASNFVNKKCPSCGGEVDRFFFISNKKREIEYTGWMEACFKCKKLIYFEIDVMD